MNQNATIKLRRRHDPERILDDVRQAIKFHAAREPERYAAADLFAAVVVEAEKRTQTVYVQLRRNGDEFEIFDLPRSLAAIERTVKAVTAVWN